MDITQLEQFNIVCRTAETFINSYYQKKFVPWTIFKYWHPRGKQAAHLMHAINSIQASANTRIEYDLLYDELINLLFNHYYYFCVHTRSRRLREKTQDALLAVLIFNKKDQATYEALIKQKHDHKAYAEFFDQQTELKNYENYFAKKQAIYGRDASQLTQKELAMIAKAGLINGKLLVRFGIAVILKRCLMKVKHELQQLVKHQIAVGYLSLEKITSYIEKISAIIELCQQESSDEDLLIQQARYAIDNIINTAGVLPLGPAQYKEHAVLIASCYWVDELVSQARAQLEVS